MKKIISTLAVFISIVIFALVSGCVQKQSYPPNPVVEKLPHLFHLEFSSQLPEYIYTTRGPIDSHKRYRVNDLLESRLERQLFARSSTNSTETVIVTVRLLELKFDYEEIGGGNSPTAIPMLASLGRLRGGLSGLNTDGGGFDLPEETVKTAIISFQVSVGSSVQDYGRHELTKRFVETVMWDDMYASWPYDYHTFDNVIDGVINSVVSAVDEVLERVSARK